MKEIHCNIYAKEWLRRNCDSKTLEAELTMRELAKNNTKIILYPNANKNDAIDNSESIKSCHTTENATEQTVSNKTNDENMTKLKQDIHTENGTNKSNDRNTDLTKQTETLQQPISKTETDNDDKRSDTNREVLSINRELIELLSDIDEKYIKERTVTMESDMGDDTDFVMDKITTTKNDKTCNSKPFIRLFPSHKIVPGDRLEG